MTVARAQGPRSPRTSGAIEPSRVSTRVRANAARHTALVALIGIVFATVGIHRPADWLWGRDNRDAARAAQCVGAAFAYDVGVILNALRAFTG